MTNLKPSSKLKIVAIISCAVIVLGMILGTVFHFVLNGFFNYSGEYSSYKTVTVEYLLIDLTSSDEKIDLEKVCEDAFDTAGVKYYIKTEDSYSDSSLSGLIEYRFAPSTDSASLKKAATAINDKIKELTPTFDDDVRKTRALVHEQDTIVGGEKTVSMAAVVLSCIVVAQLIYTMIRYRFSAAFTAIAVDLHSIGLLAAVLAICRIPVSSSVMVFAILMTLATAIGVTYLLERVKRNAKDSSNEKLSFAEVVDLSASQTAKAGIALPCFLAAVAALVFAVMAISAMSALTVLTPAMLAIVAFGVVIYSNLLFAPALYTFIKSLGKKIAKKPSLKKGE